MRDEQSALTASPVELHARKIELAVAAAEIEPAEMFFDLEIGRAVSRRPLVGEHRAAEMIAAVQPLKTARTALLAIGCDVVAELALVQQMIARRLADIGVIF